MKFPWFLVVINLIYRLTEQQIQTKKKNELIELFRKRAFLKLKQKYKEDKRMITETNNYKINFL
jgi:hypothetical protein